MTLNANALTTLAKFKTYRAAGKTQTGYDQPELEAYWEDLINRASNRIENYLSRNIKAADYIQSTVVGWTTPIRVENYPVITLYGVYSGSQTGISIMRTEGTLVSAIVVVGGSSVRLVEADANGTVTNTEFPFATYKSLSTLATGINLISGWTAVVSQNTLTKLLWPTQYAALGNPALVQYAPTLATASMSTDQAKIGTIMASAPRAQLPFGGISGIGGVPTGITGYAVLVNYRAGYETVPDVMEQACLELATEMDRPFGASDQKNISNYDEMTGEQLRVLSRLRQYRRLGV